MTDNTLTDPNHEKKYFIQMPQIVLMLSRTPQDFTLWCVIKMVAGESGECFLSTDDLAALAMMSAAKVSDCRQYLIAAGLLAGELRRDPNYPQQVWHLRIPDLWEDNIKWRKAMDSLKDRIAQKNYITEYYKKTGALRNFKDKSVGPDMTPESLHNMKPSQCEEGVSHCEEGVSHCEEGVSHCEGKKNHKKNHKKNQKREPRTSPDFLDDVFNLQGQTTEESAPAPADQWFEYRNQFLELFKIKADRFPNGDEVVLMSDLADEPDADLAIWEKALTECNLNWTGKGRWPITRAIEVYRAGGSWAAWRKLAFPGDNGKPPSPRGDIDDEVYKKLLAEEPNHAD